MNSAPTRTPVPARGKLHGMTVVIKGDWDSETTLWTVLDRSPRPGHWWLHRRDDNGVWVTCERSYRDLVQVIE